MPSRLEQLASLLDQPATRRLLAEASALRDRTLRAQEATLGALNLPTASDFARLERRLRSMTDGLVRLEEQLDRVEVRMRRAEQEIVALRQDNDG